MGGFVLWLSSFLLLSKRWCDLVRKTNAVALPEQVARPVGGETRELGCAARTSAASHLPCAPVPLQQPLVARSPPPPGTSSSSWHGNRLGGWWVGAWGRGSCYLWGRKMQDSISYVTIQMFWLFLEFRILVGGHPGGGLRGASVCLVYCEAGGGWGHSSCWQVCDGLSAHPPVCVPWVLTQRGWQLTARAHGSLRVTAHPGQSPLTDASPCPSHPTPCPLLWPGPGLFVIPPMDHFENPVYCAAPRHNTLHRSNLYIWQIKLDIIVKKKRERPNGWTLSCSIIPGISDNMWSQWSWDWLSYPHVSMCQHQCNRNRTCHLDVLFYIRIFSFKYG